MIEYKKRKEPSGKNGKDVYFQSPSKTIRTWEALKRGVRGEGGGQKTRPPPLGVSDSNHVPGITKREDDGGLCEVAERLLTT